MKLFAKLPALLIILLLLAAQSMPAQEISFTEHAITVGFSMGRDLYAQDINKDGFMDFVAGGGSEVSWWENEGNNNFTRHVISNNIDIARSVRAEDIDGDGEIDILAAVWQKNDIVWWRNNGDEVFIETIIDDNFIGPHTIDIKDVNGDGHLDVLCSGFNLSSALSQIAWWENDGTGSFTKHLISERFQQSPFIFGQYINNDEHMDILACGELNGEVVWWHNDGNGNIDDNAHIIDNDYHGAHTVIAIDLDRDDDMDILGTATMSSQLTWWENIGDLTFVKHHIDDFAGAIWIDGVDLDMDGDLDLIGAGMGTNNIAWWKNDGNQNFQKQVIEGDLVEAYCVNYADIDNDSDFDLIAIGKGSNKINWYENDLISSVPYNATGALNPPFQLYQNSPNPFNPVTTISFELNHPSTVTLVVYDIHGRVICNLVNGDDFRNGLHSVEWDGLNTSGQMVCSGVYLYKLMANDLVKTNKMLFLR